ncbi:MAG: AAA family ATPase [Candidatus Paceibacterota bacterium]
MSLTFPKNKGISICGANNVGKTNFLRALDLYFSLNPKKFNIRKDIPFDILEGKRGAGFNTLITGYFEDDKNKYKISATFIPNKDFDVSIKIDGEKNGKQKLSERESRQILNNFRFIFIEASNINIPEIIDEIIDDEVLPFGLDSLRKKQTEPLEKFNDFIDSSKVAVEKLTKDIEKIVNEFIVDIPGIDSRDWKVKILFSEYVKLRQALSGIIEFTLYDKNDNALESKGSGIQRIILISLMQYVAEKTSKKIIWGIDEPEVFLQPALQKKVFNHLKDIAKKQQAILTTHSHNFIDLQSIETVFLFEAKYEQKVFVRKPKEIFYTANTFFDESMSNNEKIQKIKNHLGISNNDSWAILPNNLLVEGEEDKEYINSLAAKFEVDMPNILVSGGASKIKGYLQFLREFSDELIYTPNIKVIVDYDEAGKKEYNSLNVSKYKNFVLEKEYIIRCDGYSSEKASYEIEDFIYPEIILEAANIFLKNNSYKPIDKKEIKNRFQVAFNNECILKFLTDKGKEKNPNENSFNFEDEGLKKIICKYACEIIRKKDISSMDEKYPEVKKYIISLC